MPGTNLFPSWADQLEEKPSPLSEVVAEAGISKPSPLSDAVKEADSTQVEKPTGASVKTAADIINAESTMGPGQVAGNVGTNAILNWAKNMLGSGPKQDAGPGLGMESLQGFDPYASFAGTQNVMPENMEIPGATTASDPAVRRKLIQGIVKGAAAAAGGAGAPENMNPERRAVKEPTGAGEEVGVSREGINRGPLEALLPTSEEDYVEQPQPNWMAERLAITGQANPTYDQILGQSGQKPELEKMAGGLQGFLERFGRNLGDVGSEQPIGTRTNAAKAELASTYNEKKKEYDLRRQFELERWKAKSETDLANFDYKKSLLEADVQKKNLWDAQMIANDAEYYSRNPEAFKAACARNGMTAKAYREMVASAPIDPTDPTGKRRIFAFTPAMRARAERKQLQKDQIDDLTPLMGPRSATLFVLSGGKAWMKTEQAQMEYERLLELNGPENPLTAEAKTKWEVASRTSQAGILWDEYKANWFKDRPALKASGRFSDQALASMDMVVELSYRQRKHWEGGIPLTPDQQLELRRREGGKTETNKFYSGKPASRFELLQKANPNMDGRIVADQLDKSRRGEIDPTTMNQIYGATRIEYKDYLDNLQQIGVNTGDPAVMDLFLDELESRMVLPLPNPATKNAELKAFYQEFKAKVDALPKK